MSRHEPYDVLGIGFGPANIALAIALEERLPHVTRRFVEARDEPAWQPGMMLDGADIQNHPVRDLVSLRNPRSRYSFINFLFEQGRLIEHLNLPMDFPFRKEYAQYVQWTARHFAHEVDYGCRVADLSVEHPPDEAAPVYVVTTESGRQYRGRVLVMGTGRTPYVPEPFASVSSERVVHLVDYLPRLQELTVDGEPDAVAVVGGSQSAVELALDLCRRFRRTQVTVYARSYSLRQKDTSPFSEEGFFPDFTDYYYRASRAGKQQLDEYLHYTNYSSADRDVLTELYTLIYEQQLDGAQRVFVQGNRQVRRVTPQDRRLRLESFDVHTGTRDVADHDFAVLATGFRNLGPERHQELYPPLLRGIADRFRYEADGRIAVGRDYGVVPRRDSTSTPTLFLNGLCESSHGIGDAGSFSLLSLRTETLADAIAHRLEPQRRGAAPEGVLL